MRITSLALLSVINVYVVSAAEEPDTQSVWSSPVEKKKRALNAWNDWSKPTKQPVSSAWNGKWNWDGNSWNWSWGPKPTKKPTSWDSSWSGKGPTSWVVNGSGGDDAWTGNGWLGNGWGPKKPTDLPTQSPSLGPSEHPSEVPSNVPSGSPSLGPSDEPSFKPSSSLEPSNVPSALPSAVPSMNPTISINPSLQPSIYPSRQPSPEPSLSSSPSSEPSISLQPTEVCGAGGGFDCREKDNDGDPKVPARECGFTCDDGSPAYCYSSSSDGQLSDGVFCGQSGDCNIFTSCPNGISDCPTEGYKCAINTCCGNNICMKTCDSNGVNAISESDSGSQFMNDSDSSGSASVMTPIGPFAFGPL